MDGEADGADEFARTRLDALRRFAYLICGSAAEADDLAQLAVVEVWRRWSSVRVDPEAYARRVIVTRNVSRWRRWRREVPADIADRDGDDPARGRVTDPVLWEALHALGKPERTVVVLHVLYRYTFDEVAAMSGEPRGTVSSRYSRALRTLRDRLRGTEDDRLQGTEANRLRGTEDGRLRGTDDGRLRGTEGGRLPGAEDGRLRGTEGGWLPGAEDNRLRGTGEPTAEDSWTMRYAL